MRGKRNQEKNYNPQVASRQMFNSVILAFTIKLIDINLQLDINLLIYVRFNVKSKRVFIYGTYRSRTCSPGHRLLL